MIIKVCLIYLFLIQMAFPQVGGGAAIQEAGTQNFSVQSVDPTTTPIAGKKYLYNVNSQLKTKDNLANVERVNKDYSNYVQNFDAEEGLLPYVFTATRAVLNTVTPLEGLRSIDFDGTAINDFIETPLITIPRILMGQVCMIKLNIKGGDANLQLQVVNGAGTVVGFKQLAVFTDSTPQFITFNCPTQALITATPALGQLKIKVVQSTATNSALATIDNFYLGRFESNQMVVSEGSQWYYYAVNGDLNGNVTFPAPTASTNDKTLFTYTGTTLTILKPSKLSIDFETSSSLAGTSTHNTLVVFCTVNGVERVMNINRSTGNTSFAPAPGVSSTIQLSPGDSCRLNVARDANLITAYSINITATALPQTAVLTANPNMPAGWLGQRTWAKAGCAWTKTTAPTGPFPLDADCSGGATNYGLVVPDAVTDGQLPKVTLSKLPKGIITVKLFGRFEKAATFYDIYWILSLNGGAAIQNMILDMTATADLSLPYLSFTFRNSSELTNATIELMSGASAALNQIVYGVAGLPLNIVVSYEPDLSDPYNQSMVAVLPPQVINSSGKRWRTESCLISNNGTASFGTSSCTTWLSSVTRASLGVVNAFFINGIWALPPDCVCSSHGAAENDICDLGAAATTGQTYYNSTHAGTMIDGAFRINCQGFVP